MFSFIHLHVIFAAHLPVKRQQPLSTNRQCDDVSLRKTNRQPKIARFHVNLDENINHESKFCNLNHR